LLTTLGVAMHVLTSRERVVVTAIAEALFWSGEPTGATTAGVASYVDTLLARLSFAKRVQTRALLLMIEVGAAIQRRGRLFSAATLDERVARLRAWERSDVYAAPDSPRCTEFSASVTSPIPKYDSGSVFPAVFRSPLRRSGVPLKGTDFPLPRG
jgi:hypothetical protein